MHCPSAPLAFRCTLLVLALVALSAPASAQLWTPLSSFNAGDWTTCVAGPDGNVFVIHQSGTVYRSTDNGAHWANSTPANVLQVTAILPQPYGVVYAGATVSGGPDLPPLAVVFESFDGGASWSTSTSRLPGCS